MGYDSTSNSYEARAAVSVGSGTAAKTGDYLYYVDSK